MAVTLDHYVRAKLQTAELDDGGDVKDLRRQAVDEWEQAGELQSMEDKALSNRDRRGRKFPKFKRR